MFNFISWESFLTITAVVIVSYYAITSLAFYYQEIKTWIRSLSQPKAITSTSTQPAPTENLMGLTNVVQQQQSIRSSSVVAEELVTSGNDEEPEALQTVKPKDELLIGSVADLLEEVKTLIQLIAEYGTGKTESEALFNALFIRYPHLQHTTYPLAISFYICEAAKEQFSYELTTDEVMSWWNSSTSISK